MLISTISLWVKLTDDQDVYLSIRNSEHQKKMDLDFNLTDVHT